MFGRHTETHFEGERRREKRGEILLDKLDPIMEEKLVGREGKGGVSVRTERRRNQGERGRRSCSEYMG